MFLIWVVAAAAALPATGTSSRQVDFQTRLSAQAAIEGVYWRHRIWPADNDGPKPALDAVMPESALRAAVENSLLESKALEQLWGHPIGDAELQDEIDRMAASSRAPGVLQELFEALGNDPVLVAECLARPVLADRLIREAYARDPRIHLELKTAIEKSLARRPNLSELRRDAEYAEAIWVRDGGRSQRAGRMAGVRVVPMDDSSWRRNVSRLEDLPPRVVGGLQEDDERFFVQAVLERSAARLRVATVAWPKTPFDEWWAAMRATLLAGSPEIAQAGSVPSLRATLPVPAASSCVSDTWVAVQTAGAPSPRESFSAVWTGTEMILWGGYNATTNLDTNTGGRYNPATNAWTATTTTNAPVLRDSHTAVWTGTKMVIWAGCNETFIAKNTGGRYDPATNSWQGTSAPPAAVGARLYHTAVWTGSKMIVWGGWAGGTNGKDMDSGGLYDPTADSWATVNKTGAPTPRDTHTAVWSGTRMVVWGGQDDNAVGQSTGARYDPVANSWAVTSPTNAPVGRWMHTSVWTGSRMIVWGGFDGTADRDDGGLYDPAGDAWTATSSGAPQGRELHVAVWADTIPEMIVWGGQSSTSVPLNTGGRYNPATGLWAATSDTLAPVSGRYGVAVWTGSEMIVWGGWNSTSQMDLNTGGRYCDAGCSAPAPGGNSTLSLDGPPVGVSWTAIAGADTYDLVRGSLTLLNSSGGDYTSSTQACLANDQAGTSVNDTALPAVGSGFFYLVRGVSCGGAGTYDSGAASQVGSRDAEVNASANSCP